MVAPSPCRQRRHDRGGPQGGDLDARGRPEGPHSSRADVGHCSARLVESAPNRPDDGHGTHLFGPGTSRSCPLHRNTNPAEGGRCSVQPQLAADGSVSGHRSCCGRGSRNWASRLVAESILRAEKRKVLGIGGRPAAHWEDIREPSTRSACARSSRRCWCNGPRRTPGLGAHLVATCPEVGAQNRRAEGARPHLQEAPVEGGEDLAARPRRCARRSRP